MMRSATAKQEPIKPMGNSTRSGKQAPAPSTRAAAASRRQAGAAVQPTGKTNAPPPVLSPPAGTIDPAQLTQLTSVQSIQLADASNQLGSQQAFFIPLDAAGSCKWSATSRLQYMHTVSGQQIVLSSTSSGGGGIQSSQNVNNTPQSSSSGLSVAVQMPVHDAQGNVHYRTVNIPVQLATSGGGHTGGTIQHQMQTGGSGHAQTMNPTLAPVLTPMPIQIVRPAPVHHTTQSGAQQQQQQQQQPAFFLPLKQGTVFGGSGGGGDAGKQVKRERDYVDSSWLPHSQQQQQQPQQMQTITMLPNGQCVLMNTNDAQSGGNSSKPVTSTTQVLQQGTTANFSSGGGGGAFTPISGGGGGTNDQPMLVEFGGQQYQFVPIPLSGAPQVINTYSSSTKPSSSTAPSRVPTMFTALAQQATRRNPLVGGTATPARARPPATRKPASAKMSTVTGQSQSATPTKLMKIPQLQKLNSVATASDTMTFEQDPNDPTKWRLVNNNNNDTSQTTATNTKSARAGVTIETNDENNVTSPMKNTDANGTNTTTMRKTFKINLSDILHHPHAVGQPIVLQPITMPDGSMQLQPATGIKIVSEAEMKQIRHKTSSSVAKRHSRRPARRAAGRSGQSATSHYHKPTVSAQVQAGANYPQALAPVPTVHVDINPPPELSNVKRVPCDCEYCKDNQTRPPHSRHTKHKCHMCEKTYGKTSHLRAHLRNHAGQKPYMCPNEHCDKSFTRSDELQRHVRTHDGSRPYACVVCCKSFLRRDHIRKHMRTHPDYRGDILPPPNRRVSKKQQIEQSEHYRGTRRSSSQVHEQQQMHHDDKYSDQQGEHGNEQAYVLNDTDQVIAATIVDITPIDDMTRL